MGRIPARRTRARMRPVPRGARDEQRLAFVRRFHSLIIWPCLAWVGLTWVGLASPVAEGVAHAQPPGGTLSLHDAYRTALQQSEQVEIAAVNRDAAETLHTGALTIMGPRLSATAAGKYQNRAEGIVAAGQPATGLQNPYVANLGGALTLPLFRRQIFDLRRATALGIEGAEESLKRAKQQLMYDVTSVFVAVLETRQQQVIAQAAIKRAETQLLSAQAKVKVGAALRTAELLAQIEVNRVQISANLAERATRQAESSFARLVGVAPPENLVLPPTPAIEPIDEALRRAQQERADMRALRFATLQAKAMVGNMKSALFWPTLDATLFASYNFIGNSNPSNPDFSYPSYGVSGVFTVPFFQGGDEWIQLRLQRQRVGIAAYQESFLGRLVADDVRQAMLRLEAANIQINIAAEQQKTAQKNYELVSTQYKLGTPGVGVLELVTAQAAVFEAETNKLIAQYDRELSTYQLLFADGKLDL